MEEIKKVNRDEAIAYLIPVIRLMSKMAISYKIKENEIIIHIPKFIPKKETE